MRRQSGRKISSLSWSGVCNPPKTESQDTPVPLFRETPKLSQHLVAEKVSRKTACENGRETASTGRPTTYTYDQLGRLVKMVNPDNGGTRLLRDEYYQYDANGNMVAKLVGVVNGSGNITEGSVTALEFDSLNRLTKVKYDYTTAVWPVSSISISGEDVSYQYAGGSSLKTQMVDASGISQYTYDTRGRLSTYTPPQPANYEVDYAYNAANEKTSVIVKHTARATALSFGRTVETSTSPLRTSRLARFDASLPLTNLGAEMDLLVGSMLDMST